MHHANANVMSGVRFDSFSGPTLYMHGRNQGAAAELK